MIALRTYETSESLCLLVVYVLYIFSMFFDDVLQSNFDRLVIRSHPESGRTSCCCFPMKGEGGDTGDGLQAGEKLWDGKDPDSREEQEDEEEEPDSVLAVPESTASRLLWAVSLPLTIPMYLTVPDCRRKRWKNWFLLTFFMSMVWSTVFSYLLIWMVTVIGFTMGASDTLMGITLLGAGTSVPDLVACVVATWAGEGDMAISATIGAIIFDILVCLGLPWFVKTVFLEVLIREGDMAISATIGAIIFDILVCLGLPWFVKTVFLDHFGVVFVQTAGLSLTLSCIFLTIAFAFAGVCLSGWQFRRAFGAACLVVYVAFIVFAVFTEEYFAGTVAVFPECDVQPP
ncbi:PREDICTED: sodium/potassium/calcium exchanger 5-like [Branchiostoma belcheri]|uniref:Sodium/potassium/calcium exchanger 5-like n=1 Tax=Branchiostoma belcheri TaxID=7741 RepID=A0A6P4XH58_BRABE|nr:PREDICTED: sodium/potassium/calcium exchanger 5-like [Branchiostoma belcheri]